jgi:hypothetical protein
MTEIEQLEEWKNYLRRIEKNRKTKPEFEQLNAYGVQCAKEISALVSIAEFGNPKASKLAKFTLWIKNENGQRIRVNYRWLDCCPCNKEALNDRN